MTVKIMEVIMPQLGVNDETISIVHWTKEEGDQVMRGQTLAIVETTKASFDLECEEDGFFYPLLDEGVSVPIQTVVALILSAKDKEVAQNYKKDMVVKQCSKKSVPTEITLTAGARKLVEKHKIDIALLPQGRIVREKDIQTLVQAKSNRKNETSPGNALQRVVIYGASEGGECVVDLLRAKGGYEVVAFLEDNPSLVGGTRKGIPIRSGDSLGILAKEGIGTVTTHIANPKFRLTLLKRAEENGMVMLNAIHPAAFIADTARMGVGNLIKAGAVVDSEVVIGDCCIIDNGVIIPHHNRIGNGCHLAPGVSMGGGCQIGDGTIIGIGATISARISIGRNVIIGVGAVVARDVPDDAVVAGMNARNIGSIEKK
jgi:sugar O-acyltransferase (sialic acid O-acetyltransferase NeuD family)